MAFLQRVINGGGRIFREYGFGRKRIDILVEYKDARYVLELKVFHGAKTKLEGLEQLRGYMDQSNAHEGHLLIFNKDPQIIWEDKIYQEVIDKKITVWGM